MKKKVTFTLSKDISKTINERVFLNSTPWKKLTCSDVVAIYLENSFKYMEEELQELRSVENPPSIYGKTSKKKSNTFARTFSIPMQTYERLYYYSTMLGIKKSHLITVCCEIYEMEEFDKLSQEIHDLVWGDESSVNI